VNKIIWACWFQGRENAPPLVERCLGTWERSNPDWEVRCLDATSVSQYVDLARYVDVKRRPIPPAALSDIVRIMLLREFGGVWVDATLYCNRPLNDWLPAVMGEGFFAFSAPAPDRVLSSWFLSAERHHPLVAAWYRRTLDYWCERTEFDDYFWFHHLFGDIVAADDQAAAAWARVPRVSADGPHALQLGGHMNRPKDEAFGAIDWSTPVFKLRHELRDGDAAPGSLLDYLLWRGDDRHTPPVLDASASAGAR
jgi:hypothetical protein